jgi:putative transposase
MGNSYTNLLVHVVFSTKGRQPMISPQWQERLYEYLGGTIRSTNSTLLAAGGVTDHVHLLVGLHASVAVSDLVRTVKANSSKWISQTMDGATAFAWQTGYAAFSVSESNADKVRRYLARQAEHHRRVSFKEEFMELLRRHGVEFDERYMWD